MNNKKLIELYKKTKELLLLISGDTRRLGDIFQDSVDLVDEVIFNPICGEERVNEVEDISRVLKQVKPLENVSLHEVSFSD